MGVMLKVLAILLMPQKRVLINAVIDAVDSSTFSELLRSGLSMPSISVIHKVSGIVMSLFLGFVGLELSVLLGALVGGLGVLAEGTCVAVEVEVRTLVALFVVVLFGPGVLVFVMGVLVALDDVALLVALFDFLLLVIFCCKLNRFKQKA